MFSLMAPAESAPPSVHPIVRLDYRVRLVTFPYFVFVWYSVLLDDGYGLAFWIALGAYGFVWPHLAYLLAKNSQDSKVAEIRNLLADSFFGRGSAPRCRTQCGADPPWRLPYLPLLND